MINYRLKDNVVTHFPAIFKGLGSKPSVIHMALDVELHGGVLAVRVAAGRPMDCGKCSRSTVVDLAKELVRRRHRVVVVEAACGFGYSFHRQLREIGVEAFVVATESLSGKRKTNRRGRWQAARPALRFRRQWKQKGAAADPGSELE
jgi:transposase